MLRMEPTINFSWVACLVFLHFYTRQCDLENGKWTFLLGLMVWFMLPVGVDSLSPVEI